MKLSEYLDKKIKECKSHEDYNTFFSDGIDAKLELIGEIKAALESGELDH